MTQQFTAPNALISTFLPAASRVGPAPGPQDGQFVGILKDCRDFWQ
ncbi:hypothetical protein [Glaciibacter psychrotolerans]|uniref:Uncharacterized protein n=1 Tax=Glaciibacter psychrotolerans TaxID=670054 RepID=A0A7Z0ECT1_9MICO|nr:hypothetical protein [Leifsonia psychrotolerans]NYJ19302.1 hypothetical protein [Leifsonia psychrotolerans]